LVWWRGCGSKSGGKPPHSKLGKGDGEMFVDEEPGGAAFFPDAGVTELQVEGFAVLGGSVEVHGDGEPSDVAVTGDL